MLATDEMTGKVIRFDISAEKKAGFIRRYGVKLVAVIQHISQIQELYEKNWEANAVFFTDPSRMVPNTTIYRIRNSAPS